jgi:hypothetical protein
MIKVNELRVGNILHLLIKNEMDGETKARVVTTLSVDQIKFIDDRKDADDFFEPIPLTPEWLDRCGLDGSGQFKDGTIIIECCSNLEIRIIENGLCKYIMPLNKKVKIEYLHQLQNLYFSLTGEELKIEL